MVMSWVDGIRFGALPTMVSCWLMSSRSSYNIGLISIYGIKVFVTSLKGI